MIVLLSILVAYLLFTVYRLSVKVEKLEVNVKRQGLDLRNDDYKNFTNLRDAIYAERKAIQTLREDAATAVGELGKIIAKTFVSKEEFENRKSYQ